jgi:cbb3-type cytochrome oxidase maturation protein
MYILILASLLVAIGFLIAFLWAVRSGQFEDKYTPKIRIIFDDTTVKPVIESNSDTNEEN